VSVVLVVDDSELTHALLRSTFQRAGLATVHAADADEALRLLGSQRIDAMVTDIVMPDVDGIQLVQLARSRTDVDHALPVVFYSAHIDDATNARQRISRLQPATIVAKDGNVRDLLEAVTSLIEAHAAVKKATLPAAVILHIGRGLVAVSVQRRGTTIYELRRGEQILFEAPTIEALTSQARSAGLA
jgi:CheY-like chemotaxis protein